MSPPVEASDEPAHVARTGALLSTLVDAALAVGAALEAIPREDRRLPGGRPGQYRLDLVADEILVASLLSAGMAVLSEESGHSAPARREDRDLLTAVVDPVDGSTNAAMGIPWYATSVCVLDGDGPLVALVLDQASGTRFEAVRGGGARRDGVPLAPSGCRSLRSAIVGVSGLPSKHPGWAQFRALGAASLDLCCVAAGNLDGYRVAGASRLHIWDYLAAVLVLNEAGACVAELDDKDLVTTGTTPRRPAAAATGELLAQLAAADV